MRFVVLNIIAYLFFGTFFSSCKKGHSTDCFKSTGSEISEVRNLDPFKYVEVNDKMEVNIFQGNEYKVEIKAGEHLIKNVQCTITNNLLKIQNTSSCNFVRGYKRKIIVNVTMPFVAKINNKSVSPIVLDAGFKQDTILNVYNESSGDTYVNGVFSTVSTASHGNGDIYLSGSAKILLIYSNGTNFTHAENFSVSDQVFISTYSIGNAYLNLQGVAKFEYYIWKQGNIYYKGTPQTISNLGAGEANGQGELIKEN